MNKNKRRFLLTAAGFVAAAALGTAQAAPLTTVRIGTAAASSDVAFYIAEKMGYFAEEGIKPEYTTLTNMVAQLGTGQLDVGGTSTSAGLYNAVARHINIKIVADKGSTPPGYGYQPLLVRKALVDSGRVKSLRDLKGLKVAGYNNGSASMVTLDEALKKGGLKFSDVSVVYMGFPQHVVALQNGAVDASMTTDPSATMAVDRGAAVRFMPDDKIYPNHQLAVLLYGTSFIRNKPEVAKHFMIAYLKAARFYNDALKNGRIAGPNADAVIKVLTESTSIKDAALYRRITPNGVNPNGHVNVASLKKDLQWYKDHGLIQGSVTVDEIVDESFVAAALKELGPYKPKAR